MILYFCPREGAMDMDGYLGKLSTAARQDLTGLRDAILAVAPEAEPGMRYGVPALLLHGRPLVCFAAFKNHYGFYPLSSSVLTAFADELSAYSTAKGTVRFPVDEPLPLELVTKMVKARLEELPHQLGT